MRATGFLAEDARCPECGYPFREQAHLHGAGGAHEGDLALCNNCGAFGRVGPDFRVHRPTPAQVFAWCLRALPVYEQAEGFQAEIRRRGPIWPGAGEGVAG